MWYCFSVNCATVSNGEIGFCNCNICSGNEGDCDFHEECQVGLDCGSNNCPASLGFDSEVDCCYSTVECAYNIMAPSCKDCGAEFEYLYDYFPYDYIGGELCNGPDCQWNAELDECQPKSM